MRWGFCVLLDLFFFFNTQHYLGVACFQHFPIGFSIGKKNTRKKMFYVLQSKRNNISLLKPKVFYFLTRMDVY